MAYGIQISVIAGLAIGIGFIVLFAVAVPAMPVLLESNSKSSYEARMYRPASYLLNSCNLPPNGIAALESTQDKSHASIESLSTNSTSTIREIIKDRTWISVVKIDRTLGLGTGIESQIGRAHV